MNDSEQEDIFYQGGYDSDKDNEWIPPKSKENEDFNSSSSDSEEQDDHNYSNSTQIGTIDNDDQAESSVDVTQNLEQSRSEPAAISPEDKLTRKRKRNPEKWQINERKVKRERGEEYLSSRKKIVPAKSIKIKKDCTKCIFKCSNIISHEEQEQVFVEYYALNSQAKKLFIVSNCEIFEPERRRKGKNQENSKKKKSIKYFLKIKDRKVQVCKNYFLCTLDVSQKTIYNAFNNRNIDTNTPKRNSQGCHTKKIIAPNDFQAVMDHINSFPRIESHYCRVDTKREYLEGNIFFHKPKKDRCSLCELNRIQTTGDGEQENNAEEEYLKHIKEKEAARKERKLDRESEKAVVTFDLQNVLTCPKAEISSFYYKSKMSVYNLTAHLSIDGQVYCSLWPEVLMGRKGNDIASALIKILKAIVLHHPNIKELTLWSDSCVPQNRNSVISYAIAHFLSGQIQLEKVTLKYSTPGHSCVQEIDSVHSVIERFLNKVEYYSPVSLLRMLLKINSKKPYKIKQMKKSDFYDYQSVTNCYNYNEVPYTKISSLEIRKRYLNIGYKTSHEDTDFNIVNLKRNTRAVQECTHNIFPDPKLSSIKPDFPVSKKEAINSMLLYMPKQDQEYYKMVIPGLTSKKSRKKTKKSGNSFSQQC